MLVKGAVNLSLRLGIPALIVSLTVVAFGTSAPELLISIKAIADGVPGLALGNVVGSNTANILLVLGVPAVIAGLKAASDTRRTFLMMIAGTLLFIALAFFGPITWWHGLILLTALAFVLGDAVRSANAHRKAANGLRSPRRRSGGGGPRHALVAYWRLPAAGSGGPAPGRGSIGRKLGCHRAHLWRQRNRHRPDPGGHRHVAARIGHHP